MSDASDTSRPESHHLQCMEVWGGNQAASTAVAMPGIDAWIYSQPHQNAHAGGDVHYASSCATGALTRMMVADVAGHGNAVADIAKRLRKLMQRHVNQHTQTRFVRAMNHEFAGMTRMGIFATAIAFSYDAPLKTLQVCNAGHPPPLIYRQASGSWSYLEPADKSSSSGNFPLGIDDVADYEEFDAPIAMGDLVLCYTDALPEAKLDEQRRLEQKGLLELASRVDVSDPAKVISGFMHAIDSIAKIDDDLTMLLFRPNGSRAQIPLTDKLMAPYHFLRALATPSR